MDLGSIFLIFALLVLVGLFVLRPIFENVSSSQAAPDASSEAARQDQKRSSLLAERDRVLNALTELDFDYAVGKIPEEDYPPQRGLLLAHGSQVLRELDAVEASASDIKPGFEPAQSANETPEARLEAAIAARRLVIAQAGGMPAALGGPAADDDLEIQIAARRRQRQEKAAGFCPQCGGPVQKSDRFCSKCGAKVQS